MTSLCSFRFQTCDPSALAPSVLRWQVYTPSSDFQAPDSQVQFLFELFENKQNWQKKSKYTNNYSKAAFENFYEGIKLT